ncbi:hypothetical protein ACJJTC_001526 [Scirpophaga incertulas]
MPALRKVSNIQMEELMAWMEINPLFAKGAPIGTLQAKKLTNSVWEELASRLNGLGDGMSKSAKEWRHYWANLKCKVRKKDTAMRQYVNKTGREPSWEFMWTPMEERILNLIGVTYIKTDVISAKNEELEEQMPESPVLTGNPSAAVAEEKDNESISETSSQTSSQSVKRKSVTSITADTDDTAANSIPNLSPPPWLVEFENRRSREEQMRLEYEDRRLEVKRQRLELEEKRLACEQQRLHEERAWRAELLSAIKNISRRFHASTT